MKKNIDNSQDKIKMLIPTLMDNFEQFRTSVEKVTADVVKVARE